MKLRITPRARREIDRIDARWRKKHLAAPNLFLEEVINAIEQALTVPHAGKRYDGSKRPDVRYVIMLKTERNLYYVVEDDAVVVLGVWGARREFGPKL